MLCLFLGCIRIRIVLFRSNWVVFDNRCRLFGFGRLFPLAFFVGGIIIEARFGFPEVEKGIGNVGC